MAMAMRSRKLLKHIELYDCYCLTVSLICRNLRSNFCHFQKSMKNVQKFNYTAFFLEELNVYFSTYQLEIDECRNKIGLEGNWKFDEKNSQSCVASHFIRNSYSHRWIDWELVTAKNFSIVTITKTMEVNVENWMNFLYCKP